MTPRFTVSDSETPASEAGVQGHGARDHQREVSLIQRMALGETAAMNELYALYSGPLFSVAMRTLESREEAEEVLQDAFVKLWDKAATYDAVQSRPFTWAWMITRGLCVDRLRRTSRRAKTVRLVPMEAVQGQEPSSGPKFSLSDEIAQVRLALQSLPAADREAVEMALFMEFTGQEIATRMQEPLGTIKSRLRRGLTRLRTALHHTP